jgi:uncharacterized protein YbjQ (UPF0145 family)
MLIVTSNDIPGYRVVAVLGEVMGMTVRSANIGANFVAGIRAIGGGEVNEYTKLVYESRQQVMERMWGDAVARGANGIIAMRFDTGDIAQAFSEVCAYGTAVVVEPIPEGEPGATKQSISVLAQAAQAAQQPQPQPQYQQPAPPQQQYQQQAPQGYQQQYQQPAPQQYQQPQQ